MIKIIRNIKRKIINIKNYNKYNRNTAPYPATIYFAINGVCNLRCIMCDVGQNNPESQFYKLMINDKKNLDINIIEKFIKQVSYFKPRIAITSTEPLLYPNLLDLISIIKENHLKLQITTNGLLLKEKKDILLKYPIDSLWVSIDGLRKTADRIRGVEGVFDKVVDGLKEILKMRDANKMSVNINFTIIPQNVYEIEKFAEYFLNLGVDHIVFSHMNFVTKEMAKQTNLIAGDYLHATASSVKVVNPMDTDIEVLYKNIKNIEKKYSNISFSPYINTKKNLYDFYNKHNTIIHQKRCTVAWRMMQIMSNGDVVIMTRCYPIVMGNIYKQTFKEIWNGNKYKQFRHVIRKNKLLPACKRCCGVL